MAIARRKVVIIGTGFVGATVAFNLAMEHICDDLVLIDKNRDRAWAEATDLQHALGYSGSGMRIIAGQYEDCAHADIVIITAAAPYQKGQTRLDMFDQSKVIVKGVTQSVMQQGFDGVFIVVTNPVDVMAYYVHKLSGLPNKQVIGTGTALDSARLQYHLAQVLQVDPQSIQAFCMGEHGDSQFIPWSQVTIGGKRFLDIQEEGNERLRSFDREQAGKQIADIAFRIVDQKGSTTFGTSAITLRIVKAVLQDVNKVMPVSALLEGQYHNRDVYIGVPAVLNHTGVKELLEYRLLPQEMERFQASIDIIKGYINRL